VSQHTALLLFIRNAEEEARLKPLAGKAGSNRNSAIFRTLNQQAIRLIQGTGLPYFIVKGADQEGTTFGEKFANAFTQVFDQGYDQVIALGNDHPGLTSSTLDEAIQKLQHHSSVIGPAQDGGLYLVDMHRSEFHYRPFCGLPWQTNQLHQTFKDRFPKLNGGLAILSPLCDADNPHQFKKLIRQCRALFTSNRFLAKLISLIADLSNTWNFDALMPFFNQVLLLTFSLRGPPLQYSHS